MYIHDNDNSSTVMQNKTSRIHGNSLPGSYSEMLRMYAMTQQHRSWNKRTQSNLIPQKKLRKEKEEKKKREKNTIANMIFHQSTSNKTRGYRRASTTAATVD